MLIKFCTHFIKDSNTNYIRKGMDKYNEKEDNENLQIHKHNEILGENYYN